MLRWSILFTSYRNIATSDARTCQSSAVVLAHSAETDLQQYVADVLFAKKPASGRMSMSIGKLFPAGTGCMIEPGMKPGKTVPEDYGMKSYVLQSIDAVAGRDWKRELIPVAACWCGKTDCRYMTKASEPTLIRIPLLSVLRTFLIWLR